MRGAKLNNINKQGCPLSPTLFKTYIEDIRNFIAHKGDIGVKVSKQGLQSHFNTLNSFCEQEAL